MSMLRTYQSGWSMMRRADVSADDSAFDGSNSGARYLGADWPADSFDIPVEANGAEIVFWGEGDNGDTFACEMWGKADGVNGPLMRMFDVTGAAGTAFASADHTLDLLCDDVTVSEQWNVKPVSIFDQGNNRVARIVMDLAGIAAMYPRFYNVGGVGEMHNINAYIRIW